MTMTATDRHSIPWSDVRIADAFWGPRLATLASTTLRSQWTRLHESGRLAPLGIWHGEGEAPPTHRFYDSDIAKWLEAVACAQAWHPDAELRARGEEVIAGYERIQMDDGYCNQAYIDAPNERWTNLRDAHELYCAGHLMEAAVAWHAIGEDRLLRVMQQVCEHIWQAFGPDGRPGYGGHPEIELALVRMAKACDEPRWRELARLIQDRRGDDPKYFDAEAEARGATPFGQHWGGNYHQADVPVRENDTIDGHAVRALYLLAGMEDLRDSDDALAAAADTWWANAVEQRMYVTGAFGSNSQGEVFTRDYDLPNREAYAETCASIAGAMVARRRLARRLDGRDGDVLERCLHNGMPAGLALDGEHYYYANPLYVQPGIDMFKKGLTSGEPGEHARPAWYGCACCPPNIARTLAGLGGYVASIDESGLDLHLHIGCTLEHGGWKLRCGGDYVWQGQACIEIERAPAAEQELRLRLPGWRLASGITLNGESVAIEERDGYAVIRRAWQAGDRVDCDFGIAARRVYAHPLINDDADRVAVQRGPLVYCLEGCDHGGDIVDLRLPDDAPLEDTPCELLPGAVAVEAEGRRLHTDALYAFEEPRTEACRLRFVPFPLWGNREPGAMQVWIPRC